ncbi:hypothetical protein HPB48_004105 [Haemaphysalis longicornis]|uniref:Uncharacterized protein n=1 Tax=Haemaphysalis longicornis TaxID=44386 RepID=A0A9J6FN71_HAELO|nr:hypothetical protein HPB48_004105 [Haemaphysalis longicornis]
MMGRAPSWWETHRNTLETVTPYKDVEVRNGVEEMWEFVNSKQEKVKDEPLGYTAGWHGTGRVYRLRPLVEVPSEEPRLSIHELG